MSRFILSATALLLLLASCRHGPALLPPAAPIRCYIMAGQSNMAGRGAIGSEDTADDPRLLVLAQDFSWQTAHEPLHFYQPWFAGLDCGHSFGVHLLNALPAGGRVGLIPCAVGSTGMGEWLGDSVRLVPLYSNLLERARVAEAAGGLLSGVLWHQGEADASDIRNSSLYEAELRQFILKCRSDLGKPQLPFFLALLADFNHMHYRDSVNAAIRRTAASLPYVYLVDTHDLSCKPDSLHFDAEGQREMGRRFAERAAAQL